MDPLSIAASVAGLLGAGAKMMALMSPIVNNGDAPPLCRAVLTELCEVTATLHQVEHFIAGRLPDGGPVPLDRYELVLIEQLAAALAGFVMTKDDLETLVDDLGLVYSETGISGTFDRARWIRKEKAIARVLARLQNHKSSLSCMLNVFSARSTAEIKHSVERLNALVEQAMASSSALSTRLERLEESDRTIDVEVSTGPEYGDESAYAAGLSTPGQCPSGSKVTSDACSARSAGSQIASLGRGWEWALQRSRVYRRRFLATSDGHSETSITTSARRRAAASIFSATSLADISHLSQFSLPILIQEVGNNQWYMEVGRPDTACLAHLADKAVVPKLIMQVETMLGKKLDIVVKHDLDRQLIEEYHGRGDLIRDPFVRVYTHASESFDIHALFDVYDFEPVDQDDITDSLDSQLHLLLKHRTADLPIPGAFANTHPSVETGDLRRQILRGAPVPGLSASRSITGIVLDPRYIFDLEDATQNFSPDRWDSEGLVSILCSVDSLRPFSRLF